MTVQTVIALLLCILAGALVWLFGGRLCVFRLVTGYPCPGCGMTRAVAAVLHGDFSGAFAAHPLWVLLPVFAFLLLRMTFPGCFPFSSSRRYQRGEAILSVCLLILVFTVYFVRLAGGFRG